MELKVRSTSLLTRPGARAVKVNGEWLIDQGGPGDSVRPADVSATDPWAQARSRRLKEGLHEVVSHLLNTFEFGYPEAQAHHLAEHYRRFGGIELCEHNRPYWHDDREIDGIPCRKATEQRLDAILAFASCLAALAQAGRCAANRQRLPKWVLEEMKPIASPDLGDTIDDHLRKWGKKDDPESRRRFVEMAATQLLSDSGVVPEVLWRMGSGPGLALVSHSVTGLYVYDVARHLGRTDPAPSYYCDVCGDPVQLKRPPRPGEGTYCRRQECQRARFRLNKQRARAQKEGS